MQNNKKDFTSHRSADDETIVIWARDALLPIDLIARLDERIDSDFPNAFAKEAWKIY